MLMADIKTHLRELSVGYGLAINKTDDFDATPEEFLKECKDNINGCTHLSLNKISSNIGTFNKEEMAIIENGLRLAAYLKEKNIITTAKPDINWDGVNTQSGNAYDLVVDGISFSLKEESFILQNMGLYQLLNIIIDEKKYQKGLHIFEKFAPKELDEWFIASRDEIITILTKNPFSTSDSSGRSINLSYVDDELKLEFDGCSNLISSFKSCNYSNFKHQTTGKFREKVFSKFINLNLGGNKKYLTTKKHCAEVAGFNLVNLLKKKVLKQRSPSSLFELFRIEEKSYYYAKTTNEMIDVYVVPSQKDFLSKIEITEIVSSVPQSQLNVITTLKNIETNVVLKFRNEIRYSHGQLNGTPEAKLYIDEGSLLIAYDKVKSGAILH